MDAPPSPQDLVLYEYPFNERVRTLLRLEDLFEKLQYFQTQTHPYCHHSALLTLFEIAEVTSRSDIKSELLQELERDRQSLAALRDNPKVAQDALRSVLVALETTQTNLNGFSGKAGQHLRDNEWLMSVRSRSIIPGGTCEFDLPSYHAWLSHDASKRTEDLRGWIQPLAPFRAGVTIILRLLRESARHTRLTAQAGCYQQMLQGRSYALMQVRVAGDRDAIPEVSANKYALWVRFTRADGDFKPRALEQDVEFDMALCAS